MQKARKNLQHRENCEQTDGPMTGQIDGRDVIGTLSFARVQNSKRKVKKTP